MVTLILISTFIVCMFMGIPIAFSMGLAALVGVIAMGDITIVLIPIRTAMAADSFVLLAIPLFMLAGSLMETGGVSVRLVRLSKSIIGHVKGALGMVVVVAEMIFSGISGSTVADVSAMASMLVPAMKRSHYKPEYAVSIVSAASAMGILIPPCIIMVVLGAVMNVSVGALFAAGFIPAFVLAGILFIVLFFEAKKYKLPAEERASFRQFISALIASLPALGMPIIIFGGILSGATTATESAALAVVYGLIVGMLVYREIEWRSLWDQLIQAAVNTGLVMFILAVSNIFSYILAVEHVPELITSTILSISESPFFFFMVSSLIFIILGSIMEPLPVILIFVPIFMPIIHKLDIDLLHYGITVVTASGIGLFLPPVGVGLIIGATIGKTPIEKTFKHMFFYLGMLFIGLIILILIPWFTTVIPEMFGLWQTKP
ncbi:MAG: TRAP transporter large permease [Pseudomonadota bacterium]